MQNRSRNKKPIIILATGKSESIKNEKSLAESLAERQNPPDLVCKITLIGEEVGKTALYYQFVENMWANHSIKNAHVGQRNLNIEESLVQTTIFDPKRLHHDYEYASNFSPGAEAIIVVFDLTDNTSLKNLKTVLDSKSKAKPSLDANIILVGNKADLKKAKAVEAEEVIKFIHESSYFIDAYIEASAKTGENVQEIFETAAKLVRNRKLTHNPYNLPKSKEKSLPKKDENLRNKQEELKIEISNPTNLTSNRFYSEKEWSYRLELLKILTKYENVYKTAENKELDDSIKMIRQSLIRNYSYNTVQLFQEGIQILENARSRIEIPFVGKFFKSNEIEAYNNIIKYLHQLIDHEQKRLNINSEINSEVLEIKSNKQTP